MPPVSAKISTRSAPVTRLAAAALKDKRAAHAKAQPMPTLLNVPDVEVSKGATKTRSVEGDRKEPSMKGSLKNKDKAELIDMITGMHSIIAQQLLEQRQSAETSRLLRVETQKLQSRLSALEKQNKELQSSLQRRESEVVKLKSTQTHTKPSRARYVGQSVYLAPNELETVDCGSLSVKIVGLPPILEEESVSRFPGKPVPMTEEFRCDKTLPKGTAIPALPTDLFSALKMKAAQPKHDRIQLQWHPAEGSPPRVPQRRPTMSDESLDPGQSGSKLPSSVYPVASVFEPSEDAGQLTLCEQVCTDPRIAAWFTKKKPVPKATIPSSSSSRPQPMTQKSPEGRVSCLNPKTSQKYQILLQCLKKKHEPDLRSFKSKLLQGQLTRFQLGVLLDFVPDHGDQSAENAKKLAEWGEAVSSVAKLKASCPEEPLLGDEEFVHLLSSIPNLHCRLSCMLVMQSFDELSDQINAMTAVLMDAIEILVSRSAIRTMFQIVLHLGNFLNEGTPLGGRKWFRMSTFQKIMAFRGRGLQSKPITHVIASHLGPILTVEETKVIGKAAQTTIYAVVRQFKQLEDIITILSEESHSTLELMRKRRRHSTLPEAHDENDRFAEIGQAFLADQKPKFAELRQDVDRLIHDYQLCVMYFGDVDAFIPIDRKIEDDNNPGHFCVAPDLFAVMSNFMKHYQEVLQDLRIEQSKLPKLLKPTSQSQPADDPKPIEAKPSSKRPSVDSVVTPDRSQKRSSKLDPQAENIPPPEPVQDSVIQAQPDSTPQSKKSSKHLPPVSEKSPLRPPLPLTVVEDAPMAFDAALLSKGSRHPRSRASMRPSIFDEALSNSSDIQQILAQTKGHQYANLDWQELTDSLQANISYRRRRESLRCVTAFLHQVSHRSEDLAHEKHAKVMPSSMPPPAPHSTSRGPAKQATKASFPQMKVNSSTSSRQVDGSSLRHETATDVNLAAQSSSS